MKMTAGKKLKINKKKSNASQIPLPPGAGGRQPRHGQHLLREGRQQDCRAVHIHEAGEGGVAGLPLPDHQAAVPAQVLPAGGQGAAEAARLGDWQEAAPHPEAGQRPEVHGVRHAVLHTEAQAQLQGVRHCKWTTGHLLAFHHRLFF